MTLAIYDYQHKVDVQQLKCQLDEGEQLMGITPVRGIFHSPLEVSFISLGLWPRRRGGWQFVPHPAKQMVKLFAAVRPVPKQLFSDYITALASAFWPVYWGWPMMMRFLKCHYVKPTTRMQRPTYITKQLSRRARDIMWAEAFTAKYEIPFVATHFEFPAWGLLQHPVVDAMLRFELSDPDERGAWK
jgi:hypothetical protein